MPRWTQTRRDFLRTAAGAALAALLRSRASPETVRALLVRTGYSHLLVNVPEMRRLGKSYPVLPWTDPDSQSAFVALTRHLEPPCLVQGAMVVYSLDPGPAE